jgi:hypothetical protein
MNFFWLIENNGWADRYVWGPYRSLEAAKREAGARHAVVTGDGLADGMRIKRGALQVALNCGTIRIADGTAWYALA